jgi:hypothetical protein
MKIRFTFPLAIFLVTISLANAQTSYPKGKYKDVVSLIKKEPIEEKLVVKLRNEKDVKKEGGNDYDVFVYNKKNGEYKLLKKVLAVSDGENLYLNGKKVKCSSRYCKVIQEGKRFLVFVVAIQEGDYSSVGVMFGIVGGLISSAISSNNDVKRYPFVFDFKVNKSTPLTKEYMYKNLLKYPEILKQFEAEKDKNNVVTWLKYLGKINY